MKEIPLPGDDCGIRAYTDHGTIKFVAHGGFRSCALPFRVLGLFLALLLAMLPLGAYVFAARFEWELSTAGVVVFHGLGGGIGVLWLLVVVYHTLDIACYVESRLSRPAGEALELEYRWSGWRSICRVSPPANFVFLLHSDGGGAMGSRKVDDVDGVRRRVKYRNSTPVDLVLHGAGISRRRALMAGGWLLLSPHPVTVYHEHYDNEANIAQTVEAMRPLAEAMCRTLHVAVEFRLAGGKEIDTLEPAHHA